jgi:hypothetical protein
MMKKYRNLNVLHKMAETPGLIRENLRCLFKIRGHPSVDAQNKIPILMTLL